MFLLKSVTKLEDLTVLMWSYNLPVRAKETTTSGLMWSYNLLV